MAQATNTARNWNNQPATLNNRGTGDTDSSPMGSIAYGNASDGWINQFMFFRAGGPDVFQLKPEHQLQFAVLEIAIKDLRDGRPKYYTEVQRWFLDKDDDWAFAYRRICDTLNLNADYLWKKLCIEASGSQPGGKLSIGPVALRRHAVKIEIIKARLAETNFTYRKIVDEVGCGFDFVRRVGLHFYGFEWMKARTSRVLRETMIEKKVWRRQVKAGDRAITEERIEP